MVVEGNPYFDATKNHYDNGKDNAAVRTMTARTMTARTTTARTTATTISTMTARTPAEVEEGKDEDKDKARGGDRGERWWRR